MHIIIAGGSGLLGSALIARCVAAGHRVTLLSRNPARASAAVKATATVMPWDGENGGAWEAAIDGADAVINLAGESIAAKRWNPAQKQRLIDSRVKSTRAIVDAIARASRKPSVLVNASAVGYYGNVDEGDVTESSAAGKDFLASLCVTWENEARRAEQHGVRVVMIRTGLVLTPRGGALGPLVPLFKLFVGGSLGSGKQWWPWIHIDDELGIMLYAVEHAEISGPVNATAPSPVRVRDFVRALGRALHRPALFPAPAFMMRIVLGEMADALILGGQRAVPERMLRAGYTFAHTDLDAALKNLFS